MLITVISKTIEPNFIFSIFLESIAKSNAVDPTDAWTVAFGIHIAQRNNFSFRLNELCVLEK